MHDPQYAPYGTEVKIFPAKGAGWQATTGTIVDANALGVTLRYANPVNARYVTTSTFPLPSIDRIEYLPSGDAEMMAARDVAAEISDALADVRRGSHLTMFAEASDEIARRNGTFTKIDYRRGEAA